MAKNDPTGRPVGAVLNDTTITTTEAKIFSFIAPYRMRLSILAVVGDANLIANGKIKMVVNSETLTGIQTARGYIKPNSATQGFTFDWSNSKIYVERNAEVAVWAYTTTATATASVLMQGEEVED